MELNHTGTVVLETPRLILRPFVMEDAAAMYKNWATDPEVTKYLTWMPHTSVQESEEIIGMWVKGYEKRTTYQWAMEDRDTGEIIGCIGVVGINDGFLSCEMGYCMSRYYWGRGLMPEALKTILDHLFGVVGMERIHAKHHVLNPSSGKVMQKVGMTCEGTLRHGMRMKGEFCDVALYAIIKSDWKQQKKA